MTIEFSCQTCGKVLRTADEKAGRQAKCPGCGEVLTIPAAPSAPGTVEDPFLESGPDAPAAADAMKSCPMCGEQIKAAAVKCRYCGETLDVPRARKPKRSAARERLEAGAALSDAWKIFQGNMGLTLGAFLVPLGINYAASFVMQMVVFGVLAAVGGPKGGPDPDAMLPFLMVGFVGMYLVSIALNIYLQLGMNYLLLRIARGDEASIGDIFQVSRFFLRYLGSSILVGILFLLGLLALILPGIYLVLMFWPFTFVLLDEDSPGVSCLSRAKEITAGNRLQLFVVWLTMVGLMIGGLLAFCVGMLFTMPLAMLLTAVAYLHMTGQPTAADD